jgi:hypothetical protein
MATALAVTFAESISMCAVAYTSRVSERDHHVNAPARARRDPPLPDEELDEVAAS